MGTHSAQLPSVQVAIKWTCICVLVFVHLNLCICAFVFVYLNFCICICGHTLCPAAICSGCHKISKHQRYNFLCPFAVVVHFWIIFTDEVCDCMEQKTCNRSGLNFIRTCFSPWNWFILAFTMSLNMCLCTLFQTCFLPEIYPLLLSPLHQGGDNRGWWAKAGLRNFQSRNLNFFATFATKNKEVWKN